MILEVSDFKKRVFYEVVHIFNTYSALYFIYIVSVFATGFINWVIIYYDEQYQHFQTELSFNFFVLSILQLLYMIKNFCLSMHFLFHYISVLQFQ